MKKNIYGKGVSQKAWYSLYTKNYIIDIYNNLTFKSLETLTKLGICIENRLYTEKEFDYINYDLLSYYKVNKSDEILQTQLLSNKNVKKEDLQFLLNQFNKIAKKYDL